MENIQNIKETSDLFKSNLFKWQLDQLLAKAHIDYEALISMESVLWKIKDFLCNDSALSVSQIRIIGSYMTRSIYNSPETMNVDISIQMMESLFEPKDYLNLTYIEKKTQFLKNIMIALRKGFPGFLFGLNDINPFCPILTMSGAELLGFRLNLYPVLPESLFSHSRLAPGKNCVRPHFLRGAVESINDSTVLPPTPLYNNSILADMAVHHHLNYIYHQINGSDSLRDAILLLKIWSMQRKFHNYGLNGHVISILVSWLLSVRKLSKQWSSYMIFKVVIQWLASNDLSNQSVSLCNNSSDCLSVDDFRPYFDVVLLDPTGKCNLLPYMSKGQYNHIQHEAHKTSLHLHDEFNDNFDTVFLKKTNNVFDNYVDIDLKSDFGDPENFNDSVRYIKKCIKSVKQPVFGLSIEDLLKSIYVNFATRNNIEKILRDGLGARVKLVTVFPMDKCKLRIGIVLNGNEATKIIDFGPSAEDEGKAKYFRFLWGEKAELRKFPDGSVLESVVWELPHNAGYDDRAQIVQRATAFLLKRHHGIILDERKYVGNQLFHYIKPNSSFENRNPRFKQTENTFTDVMKAFDLLSKKLRDLNLPLSLVDIRASHPALYYSSVFIPQPRKPCYFGSDESHLPPYHEPITAILQIESSNRWPNELTAIQLAKTSFYVAIAHLINERKDGYFASVVKGVLSSQKDPMGQSIHASGWVEITTDLGYTFKCIINYGHEEIILKSKLANPQIESDEKRILNYCIVEYRKENIWKPAHASKLQALIHLFPLLSTFIRITKRWFASQLLLTAVPGTLFSDEFIECLCVHVIMRCGNAAPQSPFSAFVELLDILSSWNWCEDPLIVEMNENSLTVELVNEIREKLENIRAADPNMSKAAAYLCPVGLLGGRIDENHLDIESEEYNGKCIWSMNLDKAALIRLQTLSRTALKLITTISLDSSEIRRLFISSKKIYDVILKLDHHYCTRVHEAINPPSDLEYEESFKNLANKPIIDFDPISEYLKELNRAFDGIALFFHDRFGGTEIGVVFNPSTAFGAWPFKTCIKYPLIVCENETKKPLCKPNIIEIVALMKQMGNGLVNGVEINSKNLLTEL